MIHHRWLGIAMLVAGATAAQNLIPDGGFENGQFLPACTTQGTVVNTWFQASTTVPGADTWTLNCALAPGLGTTFYSHFTALAAAHGGFRFTAGWGGANEAFGTALSTALIPGALYTLGGYFVASQNLGGAGGYEVWLSPTQSVGGTLLGVIGANSTSAAWRCDSLQFVAPPQPGAFLIMDPVSAYIGTDDWYLVAGAGPLFQVNQPGVVTGNINGLMGTASCPAATKISLSSGPIITASFDAGAYDVAYGLGHAVPALGPPAIVLPDGQIFNLNLATVSWICAGGPAPCLAGPLTLNVSPPLVGITITAQVVAFGVGALGVSLSQPFTLTVVP